MVSRGNEKSLCGRSIMTHNWRWRYTAEDIIERLVEEGLIREEDALPVQIIIQTVLEEGGGSYSLFLG